MIVVSFKTLQVRISLLSFGLLYLFRSLGRVYLTNNNIQETRKINNKLSIFRFSKHYLLAFTKALFVYYYKSSFLFKIGLSIILALILLNLLNSSPVQIRLNILPFSFVVKFLITFVFYLIFFNTKLIKKNCSFYLLLLRRYYF